MFLLKTEQAHVGGPLTLSVNKTNIFLSVCHILVFLTKQIKFFFTS